MAAGYSHENVPLLNLLFSLEVAIERENLSQPEYEFFVEAFCKFKNYREWRKPDTQFIRMTEKVDKSDFMRLKRNLVRLYPKHRSLFEKIGDSVKTYKDLITITNKYFNEGTTFL